MVIPVFNGEYSLPALIGSLKQLNWPVSLLEVIIVDNKSTDRSADLIRDSCFIGLTEDRMQSSYAARNRGLSRATGDIIAFTDADCRPDPEWVASGVKCLEEKKADLAAGNWVWEMKEQSLAALYARQSWGRQQYYAEQLKAGATANLFVRRAVFDKVGCFDARQIYGGDMEFTTRATSAGFRIVYCPEAMVRHPAPGGAAESFHKWWRTGFGKALLACHHGRGGRIYLDPRWWLPGVRQFLEFKRNEKLSPARQVQAFFLVWLCKIGFAAGNRKGFASCRRQQTSG